ncbi:hypothetical protein FXB73_02690 [Aggregatibacter actinomycetemcomitans]|nr:hypothetical protein FXB91_06090 [Aggregatibacter actinomycetemcomitans]TYA47692.1 hypothetical protein FXB73_02690 [Aggregatibacter actinomycetemcomitans]TYB23792.1 hypothetical protein FXB71_03805 [Aggregatibacter actinomycetemcomitans]
MDWVSTASTHRVVIIDFQCNLNSNQTKRRSPRFSFSFALKCGRFKKRFSKRPHFYTIWHSLTPPPSPLPGG